MRQIDWRRLLLSLFLGGCAVGIGASDEKPAGKPPSRKPSYDAAMATIGAETFKTYCATCHGTTAHGDGVLATQLRFVPPDLTRIMQRNKGQFAFDRVYRIIDGRELVKGHGGTDMPVWGDAFLQSREGYSPEKVKEKITEVVHFLASVQE